MAEQAKTKDGSVRNGVRWSLLLAVIATIGFRLPRLAEFFRHWREALRIGDSSGAGGWRTFVSVETTGLLIVLAIGLAVFYALRSRAKS